MSEIANFDAAPVTPGVVEQFKSGNVAVFSTFQGADFETRLNVVKAMTNATPLDEQLAKPFNLTNFVIQEITIHDEQTDADVPAARVVLIDDKGHNYACVSSGIVRALENIIGIAGYPHEWPAPIKVVAEREKGRSGFYYFTLKLA